jgi:hypothetical protein
MEEARSTSVNVKDEIVRRLEVLNVSQQLRVLSYVAAIEIPGALPMTLEQALSQTGVLDDESAAEFTRAIETGCERIDDEW